MMGTKRAILFAMVGSMILAGNSFGQSRTGTTAANFLTIGTGARGQSLGNANTAIATGGDALFWNPAGASRAYLGQYRSSAVFTHFNWIADINYNAAGVVVPAVGSGVVGISFAQVDYGTMDVRTVSRPLGTGETFKSVDLSLGLSYAQPLTSSFYFGGTVKWIRQSIRDMSASTIAVDLGFILETQYLNGMMLAASIQNFGGKMTMSGVNSVVFVDIDAQNSGSNPNLPASLDMGSWSLPLSFKFGVAVPVIRTESLQLLALGDAHQSNDNDLNSDLGGELSYSNNTFVLAGRVGYRDLFAENVDSHFTVGGGLDVRLDRIRLGFDYAYVPVTLLGSTNMFDVRISF
jgi:hypothetical protein